MTEKALERKIFFDGDSYVINFSIDKRLVDEYLRMISNKPYLRLFEYGEAKFFNNIKQICSGFSFQDKWVSTCILVEGKIEELKSNGYDIEVCNILDFMDIFMQPVAYLVDGKTLIDAIYKYSSYDIDWYIESLLDCTNGKLREELEANIKYLRNLKGFCIYEFTTNDILNIFLRFPTNNYDKKVYTYIMSDISGLYKIGKSKDVANRLMAIKIGNPTIKLEFVINADVETELHRKYEIKNRGGEWFSLNDKDINEIKSTYHVD